MTALDSELFSVFDARRGKAPELRGLDATAYAGIGCFKHHRPVLAKFKAQAARIEKLEPEVHNLGATRFREEVAELRDLARLNKLTGAALDRAMAIVREGAVRAIGLRPYPVQLMGALAMAEGFVAEMATGDRKSVV